MPDTLETTHDAFLGGLISVRQPVKGFRSGHDAVFLAAACPAQAGDRVLEAGCGAGVASACLAARLPGIRVTGVEIDQGLADLARENMRLNGFSERCEILTADITSPGSRLEDLGIEREAYDHVMANPPFYNPGRFKTPPNRRRARAQIMGDGKLDNWLRFLAGAARQGGSCTLIHTTQALPELLRVFEGRFGGLRIVPLYPNAGADAIRVIVVGHKGSRAPISLKSGIVLHNSDGSPSGAAAAILRNAQGLGDIFIR